MFREYPRIPKIFHSFIDKGNSDFDLKILEALEITENRPSLNKQLVNNGAFYVLNIF